MSRLFTVLCFVCMVAPIFGLWEKSLKLRFDLNPFGVGTTSFIEMPQSKTAALNKGWEVVLGPAGALGYYSLVMLCPKTDYTICLLFDDTDYIAGLQIAFDESRLSSVFDTNILGFEDWTTTENGQPKTFKTMKQYYISPGALATDAASRIAARDPKLLLQDGNLFVTGFNGDLYNISATIKDFTKGTTYKEQACLPWMGLHYYFNMTPRTPCRSDTMFPWFPLVYSNQLIGVGFVFFGKYTVDKGNINYFENPGKLAAQIIVPRGPECLYTLADSPGLVTMHTYFIKEPYLVTCLI